MRTTILAAVISSALVWPLLVATTPVAAASAKITICHRTHSTTNPYRRITVSQNAVQNANHGGHRLPTGSQNPPVFDPTFAYSPNNKHWGDVIPGGDADGLPYNGTNQIALNWTAAGKNAFASYCAPMTPTQFYDAEVAAGRTPAEAIADLNEQDANEDAALRAALGGSFTIDNISSWSTAVSLTTSAATQVTATSATLHGSLTVGSTSTVPAFRYGTSPSLATSTTLAAVPSPVTGTTSVTAALTGLSPATTYYFMVIGTTNAGADTEGILTGPILSFTTPVAQPAGQTITFVQPVEMTVGQEPQTLTVTASSGVDVIVTSADTSVCTVASGAVTAVAAGTCSLTATQAGDAGHAPATPVTRAFVILDAAPTTDPPATTSPATTSPATTSPATTSPATTDPSSSAPATTAGGDDGSVHGVVWFDRNRNGAFDGAEWVLPGVTVTVEGLGDSARTERVRVHATAQHHTAVTAADGSYFIGGLAAGRYRVTAAATIDGFDYTSDTDGATDWTVAVDVVPQRTGTADFAGLGRGEMTGQVFDAATLRGVAAAGVECRWSGFDDVAGTPDDTVFTMTADADGSFTMTGIPYGHFSCDGRDPVTGLHSPPVAALVSSPSPVEAALPVGATPRPPSSPSAGATHLLPVTGGASRWTFLVATLFAACGGAVIAASRRRA